MIPDIFHHYPDKTTKDLVCYLEECEYWRVKRNAINQALGIMNLGMYKPKLKVEISNTTFNQETKELFDRIDKRTALLKSCKLEGGCE